MFPFSTETPCLYPSSTPSPVSWQVLSFSLPLATCPIYRTFPLKIWLWMVRKQSFKNVTDAGAISADSAVVIKTGLHFCIKEEKRRALKAFSSEMMFLHNFPLRRAFSSTVHCGSPCVMSPSHTNTRP